MDDTAEKFLPLNHPYCLMTLHIGLSIVLQIVIFQLLQAYFSLKQISFSLRQTYFSLSLSLLAAKYIFFYSLPIVQQAVAQLLQKHICNLMSPFYTANWIFLSQQAI